VGIPAAVRFASLLWFSSCCLSTIVFQFHQPPASLQIVVPDPWLLPIKANSRFMRMRLFHPVLSRRLPNNCNLGISSLNACHCRSSRSHQPLLRCFYFSRQFHHGWLALLQSPILKNIGLKISRLVTPILYVVITSCLR
jgi:hypothetical protein